MTRIITITSGSAGVGKTHLAVNIALELVRRGRQIGLFHSLDGPSPIDRFIDIRPLIERRQQYDTEQDQQPVISRGYLGIDILSCELPLVDWPTAPIEQLTQCVQAMQVEGGYDDFLVDTSGMSPRELISFCIASPVVVLVVTPDPQTQAEAFALLRVLSLNGFSGELRLLVNRVTYAMDASEIHQAFNQELSTHLDYDAGMLEVMLEDDCVPRSERYRQAFSAVFPDSEAAAGIVVIADDIESMPDQASPDALLDWWERFIGIVRAPIQLPGKVLLESAAGTSADIEAETDEKAGAAGASA
jgi:flagellar biosynthesis protein FlhG